jgi:hypothetical protein
MKIVLATIVAAAAVVLGLGTLAAFSLSAFVEAHREELIARAAAALARPLRVAAVAPSWWPLGICLEGVTVGEDSGFGEAPFLDARAVCLSVRLWPLVLGRVEVASVLLEQPRMTLVRDRGGRWNVRSLGVGEVRGGSHRRAGARRRELHLPIEWVVGMAVTEVRDGRLEIEDRSGPTPRRFTAGKIHLRARDVRPGGEAILRLDAALFAGSGRPDAHLDLRVSRLGESDADQTPFVARIELRHVDLATLGTLAGHPDRYAGRVSMVSAEVTGTLAGFVLAIEARSDGRPLRFGSDVTLPAVPAELYAHVRYEHGAVTLDEGRATFGSLVLRATGTAETEPWHVGLDVGSAAGSAAMLAVVDPPIRMSDLALSMTLDAGGARITSGRLQLDGALVEVTGAVESLDPPAFSGRFHASAFGGSLAGTLDFARSTRVLALRAEGSAIEVAAVAARLVPDAAERVSGRAGGSVAIALAFGDAPAHGASAASALSEPSRVILTSLGEVDLRLLTGTGTLRLADATLRGVNVPAHVLAPLGEVRFISRLLSAGTRTRYPEVFDSLDTRAKTASASFTIGNGTLTTEDLLVEAGPYEIVGGGSVDASGQIRFHGDLVLSPALSAALRADLPAARYLVTSGDRMAVPFRVRGPLGRAHAEPDMKRLRALGLQLLTGGGGARRGPWGRDAPDAPDAPRPGRGADHSIIERLRRMLHP